MQNNNLQQMQSNAYNGGVMCSTMQNLQNANNAESASLKQCGGSTICRCRCFNLTLSMGSNPIGSAALP
jgi:hypothetical protein